MMDLYTGLEPERWVGVGPGVFGCKPDHPALQVWKQFIKEMYGYGEKIYGVLDIIPMPVFWWDQFGLVGPRGFSFAIWAALNLNGNNDAIFKESMINMLPDNQCFLADGPINDPWKGNQTILVGDEYFNFERFGYQEYGGGWIMQDEPSWDTKDGRKAKHHVLLDMTDRKDILRPNQVSMENYDEERERSNPIGKKMVYDQYLKLYFETNEGKYVDKIAKIQDARFNDEL